MVIMDEGQFIDDDTVLNLKNKYHLNYIMINCPKNDELEILLLSGKINFIYVIMFIIKMKNN